MSDGIAAAGERATVLEPLKDPAAFYAALRAKGGLFAGGLKEGQVHGIQALLAAMSAAHWPLAFTAYGLATPYLECTVKGVRTMQPAKEQGGTAYFTRMYDISGARPAKARELGNLTPGDGARYCGRGYVQLTGKRNYVAAGLALGIDLAENPDLAMSPDAAARILIWGMGGGKFTGKSLASYLPAAGPADHAAFTQARHIINGQDRAGEIAGYAEQFQAALQAGGWHG
jgi:putative chitinase